MDAGGLFNEQWSQTVLVLGAIIAWFVRLEARLNGKLAIDKHEEICRQHHTDIKEQLDEIKRMILGGNEARDKLKLEIRDEMHAINLQLVRALLPSK